MVKKKLHVQISNDDIRAALLNMLEDYKSDAHTIDQSRKAVLNVLKDLEESNAKLGQTVEKLKASEEDTARTLLLTQQQNALNEAILESIGDGLAVADKQGKIMYVNVEFERLTGWQSSEILGKNISDILPAENAGLYGASKTKNILTDIINGKSFTASIDSNLHTVRKDKTSFPASSIITPIYLHGEVVGLVKTFHDITKEKDIDKAKTEFVSLASHQLRTPLSAINWYTEMLLSGDVGQMNPEQEKYLTEVYKGNQRMIHLVNALLNVSRMSLGTFVLEPEKTDIGALVQTVVSEQRTEMDKKDILFSYTADAKIPYMRTDPKLMHMVIENLLSNAIKYTPNNGKIEIDLSMDSSNTKFVLRVTDTGYGIPQDQQDQIFNKLFRADNVREKDIEGTGLGLYIVKAIIDNSGGSVGFESKENVGTTFKVTIPLHTL